MVLVYFCVIDETVMSYGELLLPPVYTGRNALNGRFMKGHTPFNKGKKWGEYMSAKARKGSAKGWQNLSRNRKRPDNAGRPKKPVAALLRGEIKVFPSASSAAMFVNGSQGNVCRCCRLNASVAKSRLHTYMGLCFVFERDILLLLHQESW